MPTSKKEISPQTQKTSSRNSPPLRNPKTLMPTDESQITIGLNQKPSSRVFNPKTKHEIDLDPNWQRLGTSGTLND